MPTGYTAAVVDGKITEFPDFAMQCARAFGALIMMRDDPSDAPIPDEFKPTSYYVDRLSESRERLAWLNGLTPDQAQDEAEKSYEEARLQAQKYDDQNALEDRRLEAMLEKVRAWTPPSAQHVEMKSFMIEQINISKHGDYRSQVPKAYTGPAWLAFEIEKARAELARSAAENEKEIQRARERTEWVRQLRASLKSLEAV